MTDYGCVNGEPAALTTTFGLVPSDITTGTYIILDDCCKYGDDGNYESLSLLTTLSGMEPYTSQEVTISGGCSPYKWEAVSPLSFTSLYTTTVSNTLYFSSGTPESAVSDITITDVCYRQSSPVAPSVQGDTAIAKDVSGNPWALIFIANTSDCYEPGETSEIDLIVPYTVTQVVVTNAGCSATGLNPVLLSTPVGYSTTVSLSITMKADGYTWADGSDVYGTTVMSVPLCVCEPDPNMAWDDGASAGTIARSSSVVVAVTGNNGPFIWNVSGSGFTLDYAKTTDLTNGLNADAGACGSATITVTGCAGEITTGYVRCTTGSWVWGAHDYGCITGASIGTICDVVTGNKRQIVTGRSSYSNCPPRCCGESFYCVSNVVCTGYCSGMWHSVTHAPGISYGKEGTWQC